MISIAAAISDFIAVALHTNPKEPYFEDLRINQLYDAIKDKWHIVVRGSGCMQLLSLWIYMKKLFTDIVQLAIHDINMYTVMHMRN